MTELAIVTSAHPIDDARVGAKLARSFQIAGYSVLWRGPELTDFVSGDTGRLAGVQYDLHRRGRRRLHRLTAAARLISAVRAQRSGWIYCPDPDAALLASLARRRGVQLRFYIHEAYHGPMLARWASGRLVPVARWLVTALIRSAVRRSDLTMGVSRSVLSHYAPPEVGLVVRNCAPRRFADEFRSEASSGPLRALHGRISTINGTEAVLAAGSVLARDSSVSISMLGRAGDSQLAHRIAAVSEKSSVDILDPVPYEKMPDLLSSHDVGLIAYGRAFGEDSLPNRLFEYMAAGLAVLAPSYSAEIKDIVEGEKIGRLVDVEDPTAIAEALSWFATHRAETQAMGERARAAFLRAHHWEAEFTPLFEAMRRCEHENSRG